MDLADLPDVPFTAAQASRMRLSGAHLRRAVASGDLCRVLYGVYVRRDLPVTLEVRLAAAALVINRDAVACDRTAAWLWGVDTFRFGELDVVPPVETFVLRGRTRTRREQTRGGVRDLQPHDWVELDSVALTTPLRTALDLGCSLRRPDALAAMDALARGHDFTHLDLVRELPRFRRRRGVVQLRELAPLVRPHAESPRESWTRLALHDFGLPEPQAQWWVVVDGVPKYRLDLGYPHAQVAIEYDGREHHTSGEDRARDEARRTWLRAAGWTVVVVTARDFAPDATGAWLFAVRDALAAAQRRPRRSYVRG